MSDPSIDTPSNLEAAQAAQAHAEIVAETLLDSRDKLPAFQTPH